MIRAKLVKSRILTGSRNLRSSRGLEPYNLKVSSMYTVFKNPMV